MNNEITKMSKYKKTSKINIHVPNLSFEKNTNVVLNVSINILEISNFVNKFFYRIFIFQISYFMYIIQKLQNIVRYVVHYISEI